MDVIVDVNLDSDPSYIGRRRDEFEMSTPASHSIRKRRKSSIHGKEDQNGKARSYQRQKHTIQIHIIADKLKSIIYY